MDNVAPPGGSRRRGLVMPTGGLSALLGLGAQNAGVASRLTRTPACGPTPKPPAPQRQRLGLGAGGPDGRCQPWQADRRYPAGHRQAAPLSRGGKVRGAR